MPADHIRPKCFQVTLTIIGALWIALFSLQLIRTPPLDSGSAILDSLPRSIVIADFPVRAYVGSFTGTRAVIQFEADPSTAQTLFRYLKYGELHTTTSDIAPEVAIRRSQGEETLSMIFDRGAPIGSASFSAVVQGKNYVFHCSWPNG